MSGSTGRTNFYIGLEALFGRVELLESVPGVDSDHLDATSMSLVLRYFF